MLNDTFTQDDIDNNLVKYTHDGSESSDDVFSFVVGDGTVQLSEQTFDITVSPFR